MKIKALIILICIVYAATGYSQKKRLLQEGTVVKIKVNENLDSRVSKVGDMIYLEEAEDFLFRYVAYI
jgi:hypothetical protein